MTKAEAKAIRAIERLAMITEPPKEEKPAEKKKPRGRRPFSYKIIRRIAVLSKGTAISKEVNVVQYADDPPRLDIRLWKRKGGNEQMLKGCSFTDEEAAALEEAVHRYNQARTRQE